MSDSFREVSHVNWFQRIGESIKGVLIGIVLIVVCVGVLFWNEGRTVQRTKTIETGAKSVVEASASSVDSAKEGKLIHLSGEAASAAGLKDDLFPVDIPKALRLQRHVEMYQWEEKSETKSHKRVGGGEDRETTYTYNKVWTDKPIDSSQFKQSGHSNKTDLPFSNQTVNAKDAALGAYKLNDVILDLVPAQQVVPVSSPTTAPSMADAPAPAITTPAPRTPDGIKATVSDNKYYYGNPNNPQINDTRVEFKAAPAGTLSILAKQTGDTFEPFPVGNDTLIKVLPKQASSAEMFQELKAENSMIAWVIRVVGFILLAVGFGLIFHPLQTVGDVVPFIGSIIGFGTAIAAVICAIPVWLLTVGIAWLFYRPLLGVPLVVLAIGIPIAIKVMRKPKTPPALAR